MRERAIPRCTLRRESTARQPGEGGVIRRHETRAASHFDIEIAQRHALLDRHGAHGRTGIFDGKAAPSGDAKLGNEPQRGVLGADMHAEPTVEPRPHPLRPFERHHLRGEDMREFARAASERQRADAADGAGMTVGDGMRCTRQDDTEFRRHDMGDTLIGIADIEQPDTAVAAAVAHRPDERRAGRIGVVAAARLGRNRMILHREGEIGPMHGTLLPLQLGEGVMGVQFVQHVTVDVDELPPVGALRDAVAIPDFVEQRARHDGLFLDATHLGRMGGSRQAEAMPICRDETASRNFEGVGKERVNRAL